MNLALGAKILEFRILSGMASAQDAVAWADEEILKSECPSSELRDLSISSDGEEILKILEGIGSDKKLENIAFEYLAALLSKEYKEKSLNFFEVVNKLLVMHYHSSELSKDNLEFCIWVDDESCLVAEGVKDLEPAQEELSKFLLTLEEKQA